MNVQYSVKKMFFEQKNMSITKVECVVRRSLLKTFFLNDEGITIKGSSYYIKKNTIPKRDVTVY